MRTSLEQQIGSDNEAGALGRSFEDDHASHLPGVFNLLVLFASPHIEC